VSRFLPTRQLSNNRLTLHRTTSAKTRATATLRQLHIPPNVIANASTKMKEYLLSGKLLFTFVL